ncbi:MAG: hypothetical protein HN368_21560, partial [Spirochaetales bacterium]|nr:hypothetical protein [Spirochaetales bacterium]
MFSGYNEEAREFSQAPFWFWNDDLSEGEISRQLDDFQAHGVHAFVIHPRAGLPEELEWMSDRLLGFYRFAIEEAARRGMWVVLYDEGMYPSGSSAGQVVAENPDFACRGLVAVDLDISEPSTEVEGVAISAEGKIELDQAQTLVAQVKRRHDGHRIAIVDGPIHSTIRGLHFIEKNPERRADHREVAENHPKAGDLLNPQAMECFIQKVYQRFYDEFKEHFGTTIKAIFTDEPSLTGKGRKKKLDARPGTRDIVPLVSRILGYDFTPFLPALWDDREPDASRHRDDYARAVKLRLEETFYAPISEWCEEHGIKLTGHPSESDDIGMLRYFQWPGQDVVWRYVEPGKPNGLEGVHSTMGKCASSAMIHQGRRRNSNEFAGAYGHDMTFEEYRWIALWLLVRGCNLLYPHAFYYSIRGPRIDERPRDVGPNSPWWDQYGEFAELTGKLCWLNTDSRHICRIAILGVSDYLPWEAAKLCFESQRDFNYLTIQELMRKATVADRKILIAGAAYGTLILEKSVEDRLSAVEREVVEELAQAGIVIRWTGQEGALLDQL